MHMERQTGRRIKHAGNDDAQVVAGRAVDGVDDEGDVYLFHGCFRHSCPRCFPNREVEHPVKKDVTHRENHGQTLAFEHALRSSGRSLHVQWECDFRAEMTSHHRRLMRLLSAYDPIKPRDAFLRRSNGGHRFVQRGSTRKGGVAEVRGLQQLVSFHKQVCQVSRETPRGRQR